MVAADACLAIIIALVFTAMLSMPQEEQPKVELTKEELTKVPVESIKETDTVEQKQEVGLPEKQNDLNRIDEVIRQGKEYVDKQVAMTKMDKHIDTLSNILYLSQDIYPAIQQSGTWDYSLATPSFAVSSWKANLYISTTSVKTDKHLSLMFVANSLASDMKLSEPTLFISPAWLRRR